MRNKILIAVGTALVVGAGVFAYSRWHLTPSRALREDEKQENRALTRASQSKVLMEAGYGFKHEKKYPEAIQKFKEVIRRFPDVVEDDEGPVSAPDSYYAEVQIKAIACLQARRGAPYPDSREGLKKVLLGALASRDAAALQKIASCELDVGVSDTDDWLTFTPDEVMPKLVRTIGKVDVSQAKDEEKGLLLGGKHAYRVRLNPDETGGWALKGFYFVDSDQADAFFNTLKTGR